MQLWNIGDSPDHHFYDDDDAADDDDDGGNEDNDDDNVVYRWGGGLRLYCSILIALEPHSVQNTHYYIGFHHCFAKKNWEVSTVLNRRRPLGFYLPLAHDNCSIVLKPLTFELTFEVNQPGHPKEDS